MNDRKNNKLVDQIIYSEIVSNDVKAIGSFHQINEPLNSIYTHNRRIYLLIFGLLPVPALIVCV